MLSLFQSTKKVKKINTKKQDRKTTFLWIKSPKFEQLHDWHLQPWRGIHNFFILISIFMTMVVLKNRYKILCTQILVFILQPPLLNRLNIVVSLILFL